MKSKASAILVALAACLLQVASANNQHEFTMPTAAKELPPPSKKLKLTELQSERFWSKVKKGPGCWEWVGSFHKDGYGHLSVNQKYWLAHRLSYSINKAKIPVGLCVLHKCDNPPCCNPAHLFLGTQRDNVHDMERKKRGRHPNHDEHGRAKLTSEKVFEIRTRYADGGVSFVTLADENNVSKPTISSAIKGTTWSRVPFPKNHV